MKKFLIIFIIVIIIALFTGTWIFTALEKISYKLGDFWLFLGKFFNFFNWNKAISRI